MATIHISELEAERDCADLMEQVRVGTEFVIESPSGAIAVVRPADIAYRPGLLAEAIAEEQALELEEGLGPVFDAEFGDDLAEVIRNRKPWNPPAWD